MSGQAPARLTEVIAWLDAELDPGVPLEDYGPNGLQVEGRAEVRRVATGVTANLAFIEAALGWGADLLVVHHGILWSGASLRLTGAHGRRVRALYQAGASLAGYHLPLDGHPAWGNAVQLARRLGAAEITPDFVHRGMPVGCRARFEPALDAAELERRLRAEVSPAVLAFTHGPAEIRTLGIVTGGAPRDVRHAIDSGCDAFLSGEAGEYSQATAHEERIHFFAAGHHRTERFGPMALARAIAERWPDLEARFLDVDNPA